MLKQGKTRIAEVTDGTSNTIAIAEDGAAIPATSAPTPRATTMGNLTRQTVRRRRTPSTRARRADTRPIAASGAGPSPTRVTASRALPTTRYVPRTRAATGRPARSWPRATTPTERRDRLVPPGRGQCPLRRRPRPVPQEFGRPAHHAGPGHPQRRRGPLLRFVLIEVSSRPPSILEPA